MKYSNEIEIDLPVQRVVELFDNPDNLKYWQEGLQSFEPISGTPGQPGAKSRLSFKMGNRQMELIETITVRDLPREFAATYEAKGTWSETRNKFIPVGENKTKVVAENDFRFKGFMKVIAWLMPGLFKKQSQKFLSDFKKFAESAK